MDYSPPGSSVHGIFQARVWASVAACFFMGSSWLSDQPRVSWVSRTGRQILRRWATRGNPPVMQRQRPWKALSPGTFAKQSTWGPRRCLISGQCSATPTLAVHKMEREFAPLSWGLVPAQFSVHWPNLWQKEPVNILHSREFPETD